MPYVRTVKTASGAVAVQIVHWSRRGSPDVEHIGSANDDAEVKTLKASAAAAGARAGRARPGPGGRSAGRATADLRVADEPHAGTTGARVPGAGSGGRGRRG